MQPNSDCARTREHIEREIATYLGSDRQVYDIRRLCLRVAVNAAREGFCMGFIEGRIFEAEERQR